MKMERNVVGYGKKEKELNGQITNIKILDKFSIKNK